MPSWYLSLTVAQVITIVALVEKVYNQSLEIDFIKGQAKLEKERALTFHRILEEMNDYLEENDEEGHSFLHSRVNHHSEFFVIAQNAL